MLRGHEGPVWSVSYSHDGRRIVSGSLDGTVRVWNAESDDALEVLQGTGDVKAIAARSTWRALAQRFETVIEDARTGQPVKA